MSFGKVKPGQMFVGCQVGEVFMKAPGGFRSGWNAIDSDGDTSWFDSDEEARPLPPVADIIRAFKGVMGKVRITHLDDVGCTTEEINEWCELHRQLLEAIP